MPEAVTTQHPDYIDRKAEWQLMRDTVRGETAVKEENETYLPMPTLFATKADGGAALYVKYQARAQCPEIVSPAVQAMVGVIHQSEIKIEMPDGMAAIWEKATKDGLPLEAFHRRVTAEILQTGRYSILADAPKDGATPFLSGFRTEALINWADDRSMFVLDESGLVRNGFAWEQQNRYLALTIEEDGRYVGRRYDQAGNVIAGEEGEPTTATAKPLTEIPLVVIGPRDLSLAPETPPLIGIARSAISMYQLSADYRWQLFMTGQETLVIINGESPDAVGAGVVIELKGGSEGNAPDAKYVGPSGTGIAAHRTAIQDEQQNAANAGARLFNSGDKAAESGDALRIRYAAETASLISVATASCAGLEKALRHVAVMMGLDPEEVVVTPPPSLVKNQMTPEEMTAIMGLRDGGILSDQSVYEQLQQGGRASQERDWPEEKKIIDKEKGDAVDGDPLSAAPPDVVPPPVPPEEQPPAVQ